MNGRGVSGPAVARKVPKNQDVVMDVVRKGGGTRVNLFRIRVGSRGGRG